QSAERPDAWRALLDGLTVAHDDGLTIRGQVIPRPTGMLLGLDLSLHPFAFHPSFRAIEALPLADKVRAMRDPGLRARLLAEQSDDPHPFFKSVVDDLDSLFQLGDPPNYHPDKSQSIAARARASQRPPIELIYDALLADEGHAILYRPSANRGGDRFEEAGEHMLRHPHTILGLGDGGAHYAMICDAAFPTYFLRHWVGHPDPAKRIALPEAIRMLARDPAHAVGLADRGMSEITLPYAVAPLAPELRFGACVEGLRAAHLDDATVRDALVRLWIERGVLLFRGGDGDSMFQVRLSEVFGPLERHAFKETWVDGHPELVNIKYYPEDGTVYAVDGARRGGWLPWHSDLVYT
ncbi:MAG: hypothetical protein EOP59_19170, partial [Sphingomonadales bacterium]